MMGKIGVLLLNIGSPEAPNTKAVKRYLKAFLSDPRVVDVHPILRYLLLHGVILPFRSPKTAEAYSAIWTDKGSPIVHYHQEITQKLSQILGESHEVTYALQYAEPDIKTTIKKLLSQNLKQLIIVPLFPQYASASTGSAIQKVMEVLQYEPHIPELRFLSDFYGDPGYINAAVDIAKPLVNAFNPDMLLMSYHGLPERQLIKPNACSSTTICQGSCPEVSQRNRFCYRAQCFSTSKKIAQAMGLQEQDYMVSFQSRLGRIPWIKPYTDTVLQELINQGVRRLAVMCPAFVTDCLETLEEINIRCREQWMALGGKAFEYIPCINHHPTWIKALAGKIQAVPEDRRSQAA